MKNLRNLLLGCILILSPITAMGWGQKGHDIVAYIAECNIKPKARKSVMQALGGHTIMYYSSWMDNIRNMPEYAHTTTWHYANVDEGESYASMRKEQAGDVYTALTETIAILKDKNTDVETRDIYTRFLIHLVGDLHCPMHAGRLSDLGGNRFPVKWFNNPTNLHSIWDSSMIESCRKWSYTEWRDNIDFVSRGEREQMAMGTPLDWLNETVAVCKRIYAGVEEDCNYSWDYMFEYYPVLELQLQRAGYRLARLINEIYG